MSAPKVIINSLPKAGTHLVSRLLDLAGMESRHLCLASQLVHGRGWLEKFAQGLGNDGGQGIIVGIGMPVSIPRRFVEKSLAELRPNQYLTAHVGYTSALLHLLDRHRIRPVVVIRDPRDVVLSQAYFILNGKDHPLKPVFTAFNDFSKCVDASIDGGYWDAAFLDSIRVRCHSLDVWLDHPGTVVVKFEDLVGAKGGSTDETQLRAVKSLFGQIGLQKSDAEIEQAAAALHGGGTSTFRKGKIGESRQELSPAQLARIDAMLGDTYRRWGYAPSSAPKAEHPPQS